MHGAHREDIKDGAAYGELPVLHHGLHGEIARVREEAAELLRIALLAFFDYEGALHDELRGREALQDGVGRDKDRAFLSGPQEIERLGPLGDDVLPRGEAVVGERLVAWENPEPLLGSENVGSPGEEPVGRGGVFSDNKEHTITLPGKLRDGEGHCRP